MAKISGTKVIAKTIDQMAQNLDQQAIPWLRGLKLDGEADDLAMVKTELLTIADRLNTLKAK